MLYFIYFPDILTYIISIEVLDLTIIHIFHTFYTPNKPISLKFTSLIRNLQHIITIL